MGEGGDARHVGTAVQRYRLVQAAARRGAAVAAAIGQFRTGFIHEDHARHIFLGKGLQEQAAQAYDAGRITFSGVGAFFASPAQALGGPPSRRAAQGRPSPTAARSVRSSSSVASG